jgi:outer membrane beta-barrel protein
VYGKVNVFAEKAVHFDLSLLVGGGLVAYRDVLTSDQAVIQSLVPGTVTAPAGHVGLGARVFLARSLALRLEARDVFYSVSSLRTGKLQSQLFAEVGLSFFLPLGRRDEG